MGRESGRLRKKEKQRYQKVCLKQLTVYRWAEGILKHGFEGGSGDGLVRRDDGQDRCYYC